MDHTHTSTDAKITQHVIQGRTYLPIKLGVPIRPAPNVHQAHIRAPITNTSAYHTVPAPQAHTCLKSAPTVRTEDVVCVPMENIATYPINCSAPHVHTDVSRVCGPSSCPPFTTTQTIAGSRHPCKLSTQTVAALLVTPKYHFMEITLATKNQLFLSFKMAWHGQTRRTRTQHGLPPYHLLEQATQTRLQ